MVLIGEAGIGSPPWWRGLRTQVRAQGLPRMALRFQALSTTSALYPLITHFEHLGWFTPERCPRRQAGQIGGGVAAL